MKSLLTAAVATAALLPAFAPAAGPKDVVANQSPLAPTPFIPLPVGAVKADGWLLRQLQLQKAGLTGVSEQMYDALTPDSAWLGGKGEAWEKGPYYVRGLINLAYTLDDAELKTRAQKWIDWSLKSQQPDGQFGPATNDDWWPRMVVLYYMRDYAEATGDARVVPFFTNYFHYQLKNLPGRPLKDWGRSRAGDNIDVVLWTYNRTHDAALLDLAKLLYSQAYPWTSIYTDNRFYGFGEDFQPHHIVNISQALKMPAVSYQFTHDKADLEAYAAGVANLNRQYGRLDGQVSGTEMLSGMASTDGVELCADIERIISSGNGIAITGNPAIADQMEQVAYNSLPAHTTPQMRQITYYQLPNQVTATPGGHGFTQDYGNGNMPGPKSGFPCCCYNWHAGWPKLVQNLWAATPDGGVAAIAYGPSKLTTTVAGGTPLTVAEATEYPFNDTITLTIHPKQEAAFPLVVRIPGWADAAEVSINGQRESSTPAGSFVKLNRSWKDGDVVTLRFPMAVRASRWVNDSVGLSRGPLTFALKIDESWKKHTEFMKNFDEYEVLPKTPWNYALQMPGDVSAAAALADVKVDTKAVSATPWATDAAPVTLTLPARKLPGWGLKPSAGKIVFGKADHAWHELATAPATLDASPSHKLRVEAKGESIQVFVDDKPVLTQTDATFATGQIGLRTYGAAARFDDVTVNGRVIADFNRPAAAADWQPFGGHWQLRAGEFAADAAKDGKALLKGHADLADLTLEARVTVDPGGDAGLLFRVTDPTEKTDGYRGYYVGLTTSARSQDAEEPPKSPVTSDEPVEQVQLIPFGSAKLRVTYFPVLGK